MEELKEADKLINYLKSFSISFSLTEEQAQILLDYMEGSGYMVCGDDKGQLYQADLETDGMEETDMDHITIIVCDWNNEFIVDSRKRLEGRLEKGEEQEIIRSLTQLKKDERILDKLYEQTALWQQITGRTQRTCSR